MTEIWRDIEGYDGLYQVSNCGRVKSLNYGREGRILKASLKSGYPFVQFGKCGRQIYVHRLVAKAFIPNPDNKPEVNHIDGNKTNNHADNLEWGTRSENNVHAVRLGLMKSGGDNYQAGLTNEQAEWCREVYVPGHPEFGIQALARRFNMNAETMRKVIHGISYRNAGGVIREPQVYRGHPRITEQIRAEIRRLYVKGDPQFGARPLARRFGIARDTIRRIINEH